MPSSPPRRYWWVNQNKTYRQEICGGYMWSPKLTKSGAHLAFYDNMREVAPGDIIFSCHSATIAAIGIAISAATKALKSSPASSAPKPRSSSTPSPAP